MSCASIRILTDDPERLVVFYERVIGHPAERPAPVFAQFSGPGATLALASSATVAMLGDAVAHAANRSVIVEFEVDDVDAAFSALDGCRGRGARTDDDAVGQPLRAGARPRRQRREPVPAAHGLSPGRTMVPPEPHRRTAR